MIKTRSRPRPMALTHQKFKNQVCQIPLYLYLHELVMLVSNYFESETVIVDLLADLSSQYLHFCVCGTVSEQVEGQLCQQS